MRREIIDALRMGAVPRRGLEHFAVGLSRFEAMVDEELDAVASRQGKFKAVQGEYGTGKTFYSRWLEHRARERGFATALVQISETETPLYRMETVYRRAIDSLQTKECSEGAFRSLIDAWFYRLEEEVLTGGKVDANDPKAIAAAVGELLEQRLAVVSATQPHFAAALRAAHTARLADDHATSEGLIAWLMGNPNIGASIKNAARVKGEIDHLGASGFLRGLLEVLQQTGRKGLVLVLDEVETIQRVKSDSREKSLNAIRHLIDDLSAGVYPGLYVQITGTEKFFEGPQGVQRSTALAQRLAVHFNPNPRFDNYKAVRVRLLPFSLDRLVEVGQRIRALYPATDSARLAARVDDAYLRQLAEAVAGKLGGKIGVAPRIYLKILVDVLDCVEQHADSDPRRDYAISINAVELTDVERTAAGQGPSIDDIALDLDAPPTKPDPNDKLP